MAMDRCPSCDGFLPFERGAACPHCDASLRLAKGSSLRRALNAAGGGAVAFTLMACYGAPPGSLGPPQAPVDATTTNDCANAADDIDRDGWCDADCDEVDPDIYPGAADPVGDGLDQDCDGSDGPAAKAAPEGKTQTIAR